MRARPHKRQSRTQRSARRRLDCGIEELENRTMLSTIIWGNRGSLSNNSDGFNLYGTTPDANGNIPAELARNVVDEAIRAWESVVTDFNTSEYVFCVTPADTMFINFRVSNENATHGGQAVITCTGADGIPRKGDVKFGRGIDIDGDDLGDGGGWYFDPVPTDHAEFLGSTVNAYTSVAPINQPHSGLFDFYSVALHEIGHVLGLSGTNRIDSFVTNTGINDGGFRDYYVFNGPSIDHLLLGSPAHTAWSKSSSNNINFDDIEHDDNSIVFHGHEYTYSVTRFGEDTPKYILENLDTSGSQFRTYGQQHQNAVGSAKLINPNPNGQTRITRADGELFEFNSIWLTEIGLASPQDVSIRFEFGNGSTSTTQLTTSGNGKAEKYEFDQSDLAAVVITTENTAGTTIGLDVISVGGRSQPIQFAGKTYQGANDLMNPSYGPGTREMVPNTVRLMLQDVYGYTTVNPATRGTFYATMNDAGKIFVQGGKGDSQDEILITTTGSQVVVSVNVGDDVPGTGPLSGPGDLPAFVSRFDKSDVTSLSVDAGGGNDLIKIQTLPQNTPISVNGGDDSDLLILGTGDIDSQIGSAVTFNGGRGTDRLEIKDENDTGNDIYRLTRLLADDQLTVLTKPGTPFVQVSSNSELTTLTSNEFDNEISVSGVHSEQTQVRINSRGGNDVIKLGGVNAGRLQHLQGFVILNDSSGSNSLVLHDGQDNQDGNYSITDAQFNKTRDTGTNLTVDYQNFTGSTSLSTGLGDDSILLHSTPQNSDVTINGGGGTDHLFVGHGDLDELTGNLTVTNLSNIELDDSQDSNHFQYRFRDHDLLIDGVALPILYDSGTRTVTLHGNEIGNLVTVERGGPGLELHVNGNGGDDSFIIGTGEMSTITAGVHADGGSDNNVILFDNSTATSDHAFSLTNDDSTTKLGHMQSQGIRHHSYRSFNSATLYTGSGDNSISVNGIASDTTVNAGPGTDTILVGGNDYSANMEGNLTVIDVEVTVIKDLNSSQSHPYVFHGTYFEKGTRRVTHGTLTRMTIHAGDDDSNFDIRELDASTELVAFGNGGDDVFTIAELSVVGNMTVLGGNGADSLVWNDTQNILNATDEGYIINEQAVARSSGTRLDYEGIESMVIEGTSADNTFGVFGTPGNMLLSLTGGKGDDTFNIGFNDISQILGPIEVNGGSGFDKVRVNDTGYVASPTFPSTHEGYTITDQMISRPLAAAITYSAQDVVVNAGQHQNGHLEHHVLSNDASTELTFNSGPGDDRIALGSGTVLADIVGPLTINGQSGSDLLALNNSATTMETVYDITESQISFQQSGQMFDLTYGTFELITLHSGSSHDMIRVGSTMPGTNLTLSGNSGRDEYQIMSPPSSQISILAGTQSSSDADTLSITGTSKSTLEYEIGGSAVGMGSMSIDSHMLSFQGIGPLQVQDFGNVTVRTPHSEDNLFIDRTSFGHRVRGTSDETKITPIDFSNVVTITIDMATNDETGSANDVLTLNRANLLRDGTDLLTVNLGSGKNSIETIAAVTNLSFTTTESPRLTSIEVRQGSTVNFVDMSSFGELILDDDAAVSFRCRVANTSADGPGSLLSAIGCANAALGDGPAVVEFRIPVTDPNFEDLDGGLSQPILKPTKDVFVISPEANLPALNNPRTSILIDGRTQTNWAGNSNQDGPELVLDGNRIEGNAVGLRLFSNSIEVRGLNIQRFSRQGIFVRGSSVIVAGNFIGTDARGESQRGNGSSGVLIVQARHARIGGTTASDKNVISGNAGAGVHVIGRGARRNSILGNIIGRNASGKKSLGNGAAGVLIDRANRTQIGGRRAGNIIAHNDGPGVQILGSSARFNSIRMNSIYANAGIGIDLGKDGSTVNDRSDKDTGPNGLQNHPIIRAIHRDRKVFAKGTLRSLPRSRFTIDFYVNDRSNGREGKRWVGSVAVTTNGKGLAAFEHGLNLPRWARMMTATATSAAGETSEFSKPTRL